nr:MAG TPA: hypothetical protein [Caudoviricetes sp.]
MKLNTEIWGTGEQISGAPQGFKGLRADFPRLADWIEQGKVALNQHFDQSFLIGTVFKNPNSVMMWCDRYERDPSLNTFSDPVDTGVFLAGTDRMSNYGSIGEVLRWRVAYDQAETSYINYKPLLKFPFKGLCFLPIIYSCANKSVTNDTHQFSINDYYNGENENTYPYIIGIELRPYLGTTTDRGWYINDYIGRISPCMYGDFQNFRKDTAYTNAQMFPMGGNLFTDRLTWGLMNDSVYYDGSYNTYDWLVNTPYGEKLWEFVAGIRVHTHFTGTKNDILKMCANTGCYCALSENAAMRDDLNNPSDDIIIGKMGDDGSISDTPLQGDDIKDNTLQDTWNEPDDTGNGFNGIENTDPNNYTDKIDLNKPTLSNVNVFNRSFAVNAITVKNLADFLWNTDETKFQEIVKGLALMGENPMNGIIDLRMFPFNVALKNSVTEAEPVVIGRTNTGVNGIKLTENVNSLIDLGECTFFEKFKNFLDFEPYTTAQLYIPYIGVVPVSTAEFMGHKISVKMICDYTTGAGTAIVFKDDIPFIYRNGVLGVSIPMTGNDSASYANTVVGNVVGGAVGGLTSIASGNVGGVISGAEKMYSGFATGTNYQEASASSPSVATWQPQKCYFIIDRPILNVPENYGRTVGFACEETGKLADFKGFTVVSNPEINFRCTDTERKYIINMLESGVFV